MEWSSVTAFWAVSFLFVIIPGADWAYVMSAGIRHRTLAPAISGLLAGHLAATVVVAAGVAALMASSPGLLTGLSVVGALYLAWLGWGQLRSGPVHPAVDGQQVVVSRPRQALAGFGVSGLNPKVFLLFLALLPQFVDQRASWPATAQILTLGLVHVASCAAVYTAVGVGARRMLRTRPVVAHRATRVSGAAMMAIGAILVAEQALR